jgi:hypothetical protein
MAGFDTKGVQATTDRMGIFNGNIIGYFFGFDRQKLEFKKKPTIMGIFDVR